MRQRLSVAAALLGSPRLLVLDEPANGLDPEGIRWLRDFLRSFAGAGGTVLISSHVLAEVAQIADEVVIIHHGRLVAHEPLAALTARTAGGTLVARRLLRGCASSWRRPGSRLRRPTTTRCGSRLRRPRRRGRRRRGIVLHELREEGASLEEVFLELTGGEMTRLVASRRY